MSSIRRPVSRLLPVAVAVCLSVAASGAVMAGPTEDSRAQNAVRVLNEVQAIPESGIPDRLLEDAKAIIVVPDTLKVGLVLGGRRGHGLLSVKNPDGTWSNPSFIKLTGGSIGFQAGVQSADIVLVFRNDRSLESIVNGKITLGADAGVAAGPVGRNASAATDGQLKAEIWSWSRARGLFAGIALDGAALTIDDDANQLVYGANATPRAIFEGRAPQSPSNAVVAFRDHLEEVTAAARQARTGSPTPAPGPAATPAAPSTSQHSGATTSPVVIDPSQAHSQQPSTFEPVEDNPATIEPLDDLR